ncbi:SIR2 family protein [Leucobacter sp. HNU]|uniref:SIR2 family protein n=1 Tax=Leucobacter sp. HNU TaxID=3236805 RepID=UPI003A7FA722
MEKRLAVLGGYTNGWQEIDDTLPEDDDAQRTLQETALASLREELSLITNSETLIVLAGSGASLGITDDLGVPCAPSMADLWNEVEKLPSFATVSGDLAPAPIAAKNLEHVLSDAQARAMLDPSDTNLATFITEAEDIVWSKCSFIDDHSELGSHELFLRKVARRSTRLQRAQIFTTNYDLAFESAARRTRFNVIDGFGFGGRDFDGGSFDLDYVRRLPNEPLALDPSVFHLLKLHGSVDWTAVEGGVQKVFGGAKPPEPVLIYPSATKYQLSYRQPYLEFMSRFQIALRQPDVGLIVVGFGFNDDHLSAPIEAALRSNIGLRAVFVSFGARDPKRAKSMDWIEQLITKGDRRLTILETTFDEFVRVMPEAPAREERDAHVDRVSPGVRGLDEGSSVQPRASYRPHLSG